jgi:hypothetical protein
LRAAVTRLRPCLPFRAGWGIRDSGRSVCGSAEILVHALSLPGLPRHGVATGAILGTPQSGATEVATTNGAWKATGVAIVSGARRAAEAATTNGTLRCADYSIYLLGRQANTGLVHPNCIASRPQVLAADRQIGCLSGGFGNPPGADCGVLIILQSPAGDKRATLRLYLFL